MTRESGVTSAPAVQPNESHTGGVRNRNRFQSRRGFVQNISNRNHQTKFEGREPLLMGYIYDSTGERTLINISEQQRNCELRGTYVYKIYA